MGAIARKNTQRPEGTLSWQGLQWAALRCLSSTGEASAPEDYHWLMAMAGYKPVIEICGGTEIGGGFLAGSMLQPQCPSTFSTATMGEDCQVWPCKYPVKGSWKGCDAVLMSQQDAACSEH